VYLADFGTAHNWHGQGASTNADAISEFVTYCAPELSESCPKKKNAPADVWSLGCVFLEMYTVLKGWSIDQLRLHLDLDIHFQDILAVRT
jgi:serine/threonine protein kinase